MENDLKKLTNEINKLKEQYMIKNFPKEKWHCSGDVLFLRCIGRTDLPGGNYAQLIDGIHNKLLVLPKETRVFAGHGFETTIGYEQENNPFLC